MSFRHFEFRVKKVAESAFAVVKTHCTCGATQGHFLSPRFTFWATWTKPGLCIIDGTGPSLQLAKTRGRKVRDWVTGTMVSMETDGLEIVRRWSGQGELNGILQCGRTAKGTRLEPWSTWEEKTGVIQLFDTLAIGGRLDEENENWYKDRKIGTNFL